MPTSHDSRYFRQAKPKFRQNPEQDSASFESLNLMERNAKANLSLHMLSSQVKAKRLFTYFLQVYLLWSHTEHDYLLYVTAQQCDSGLGDFCSPLITVDRFQQPVRIRSKSSTPSAPLPLFHHTNRTSIAPICHTAGQSMVSVELRPEKQVVDELRRQRQAGQRRLHRKSAPLENSDATQTLQRQSGSRQLVHLNDVMMRTG